VVDDREEKKILTRRDVRIKQFAQGKEAGNLLSPADVAQQKVAQRDFWDGKIFGVATVESQLKMLMMFTGYVGGAQGTATGVLVVA
jgi:hypothetical protein